MHINISQKSIFLRELSFTQNTDLKSRYKENTHSFLVKYLYIITDLNLVCLSQYTTLHTERFKALNIQSLD
jgi:hypothetical protein